MKILLWSRSFPPVVGGLPALSCLLAEEFAHQGHQVTVVTKSSSAAPDDFPFTVARCPSLAKLLSLVRDCEVYLHNHVSLKGAWPLLLFRRPWVIAHHTWIPRTGVLGILKHFVLNYAQGISCSREIAEHVHAPSTVIHEPYDDRVFHGQTGSPRDQDVIFVGRLDSEKGAHLLLEALRLLRAKGQRPRLTVVGDGPERAALARQADEFELADQVKFVGSQAPPAVAALLNRHRILVVPSLYREPFGMVAIEGIACGCAVVGSSGGGLAAAIGPCGITFPNGDAAALADRLADLLGDPDSCSKYRRDAPVHLRGFTRVAIANSYLAVLRSAYAART